MTTLAAGPSRPSSTRAPRYRRALAAGAALALIALASACSAGQDDSTAGATSDVSLPEPASAPERAQGDSASDLTAYDTDALAADAPVAETAGGEAPSGGTAQAADVPGDPRSLIKRGNIALRSDDVPTARFDVGKVVAANGGEIAEESTQADDDGNAERVQLVVRVPVEAFDTTMTGLTGVADLIDKTTNTEDVSTEVIDNDVRVELQRRSIDRISILLDNAADLRDIVSIERELSNREADLGSLEKRQKFLADQTAQATITLSIEPPREEKKEEVVKEEKDGFLAGLDGGWTALKDVTNGLLTVGGAVLPFALVLLVLAVPGRLLVRRLTPRRPATVSTPPVATA